jgi:hypothetical protein
MSHDLIFIPTVFHWNQLKDQWNQLKDSFILTYDFSVGSLAQNYGNVIYVQSFITEDELKANDDEALDLIKAMGQLFSKKFVHRGVDLAYISARDHRSAMIALLNMRIALKRIFEDLEIKQIYLFQELFKPDFAALPNTYYPDIIQALISVFALKKSIGINWLPGVKHTDMHSDLIFHIISENSRKTLTGNLAREELPFSGPIFDQTQFKRTVFLVGYQMEIFDQEQLFTHYKEDPETLLIFLSLQNTPIFEKTLSYLGLDFRYLKLFPFELTHLFQEIDICQAEFCTMDSEIHRKYPEIFNNAFLEFQYKFFFNTIKDNARTVEGMYWISQAFKPDLVLGGGSATAMSAVAASLEFFTQNGFSTLGIMHGTMYADYQFSYIFFPFKHLAVRGKEQLIQIEKSLKIRSRTPQLNYLGDLRQHMNIKNINTNPEKAALEKIFAQKSGLFPILLVTSSFNNGMAENICNPEIHFKTWIKLKEIAKRRKDLCFFVKNHPGYDFFGFYADFCNESSPFILLEKTIPITLILEHIKLAICVNNYTSAMIECASFNIPFLYLRDAVYKNGNYINSKIIQNPALLIEKTEELENTVDRFIQNTDFQSELQEAGKMLVKSFTSEMGSEALSTALTLTEEIIAQKNTYSEDTTKNAPSFVSWITQLAYGHLLWKQTGEINTMQNIIQSISHLPFSDSEKVLIQDYLQEIKSL